MSRVLVPLALGLVAALPAPAAAQAGAAAGIQQVPTARPAAARLGVAPVGANRDSRTVQAPDGETVPPAVSAETLATCRRARAQDRPAPKGVDCVRALQVATPPATPRGPTAETSLLGLLGQNPDLLGSAESVAPPASADQVARQLSSGEFQGTVGSDAAASVARDRAPPANNPPPR